MTVKKAPCAADPDLFYPAGGRSINDLRQIREAKAICQRCPVLAECAREVATWPSSRRDVGMVAAGRYWRAGPDQYERSGTHVPRKRLKPLMPIDHGSARGYRTHIERKQTACDDCLEANAVYQRARRANKRAVAA